MEGPHLKLKTFDWLKKLITGVPLFDGQLMNSFISKMGHSRPLFLYFCIFYLNDQFEDKVCQCWDSNRGSLVSEATPLPTEPPPLP